MAPGRRREALAICGFWVAVGTERQRGKRYGRITPLELRSPASSMGCPPMEKRSFPPMHFVVASQYLSTEHFLIWEYAMTNNTTNAGAGASDQLRREVQEI